MDARINGITMHWQEVGRRGVGPTLLLVHGFPLDRAMWRPQFAALAKAAHLVAPDLRGHGASDAPPGPYAMDDFAADLRALLAHLGVEHAVYCGLSMGGYIAFAFARAYPELLRGLILADTRAGADTDEARAAREQLARLVEREGSAAAVERLLPRYVAPATREGRPDLLDTLRRAVSRLAPTRPPPSRGSACRPPSSSAPRTN